MGVVAVNYDPKYLEGQIKRVIDAIERMHLAEIMDCQVQITKLGPELI